MSASHAGSGSVAVQRGTSAVSAADRSAASRRSALMAAVQPATQEAHTHPVQTELCLCTACLWRLGALAARRQPGSALLTRSGAYRRAALLPDIEFTQMLPLSSLRAALCELV